MRHPFCGLILRLGGRDVGAGHARPHRHSSLAETSNPSGPAGGGSLEACAPSSRARHRAPDPNPRAAGSGATSVGRQLCPSRPPHRILDAILLAEIGETSVSATAEVKARSEPVAEAAAQTNGEVLQPRGDQQSETAASTRTLRNGSDLARGAKANEVSKRTQEKFDARARRRQDLLKKVKARETVLALCQELGVDCTAFTQKPAERPAATPGRPKKQADEPAPAEKSEGPRKPRRRKP
jgi:hypothetical protein